MSAVKKMSVFFGVAVASLFVLFVFRTVPSGNLWERYRIVYVDNASDDDYAAEVLKKAGCENVISLSSQRLPVMLPVHSPEVSLALAFSDADGYLAKRRAYFFDRGAQYRLYYIEDRYAPLAEDLRVERNAVRRSSAAHQHKADNNQHYSHGDQQEVELSQRKIFHLFFSFHIHI